MGACTTSMWARMHHQFRWIMDLVSTFISRYCLCVCTIFSNWLNGYGNFNGKYCICCVVYCYAVGLFSTVLLSFNAKLIFIRTTVCSPLIVITTIPNIDCHSVQPDTRHDPFRHLCLSYYFLLICTALVGFSSFWANKNLEMLVITFAKFIKQTKYCLLCVSTFG